MALLLVAQDLINALGANMVRAIYDDDNSGTINTSAMDACLEYAEAEAYSFVDGYYSVDLPFADPPIVFKFAAVDFACAYSARRRPDIWRSLSEKDWESFTKAATDKMKRFASSLQRLPITPTLPAPRNVGGLVVAGEYDGEGVAIRRFDDMGDF